MAIVRRRDGDTKTKGRVDSEKIKTITEADLERWDIEDGTRDEDVGPERFVLPKVDVRDLREKLRLSQEAFAKRFYLPLRTIQEWEQHRREPSEPARVLLFAISQDPVGVRAALDSRKRCARSR
jgi:putative transcriptional regulator